MPSILYDYARLPDNPFAVFFINNEGEVFPKRMFTVTRKRFNGDQCIIEIYIVELSRFIEYKPETLSVVHNFLLN